MNCCGNSQLAVDEYDLQLGDKLNKFVINCKSSFMKKMQEIRSGFMDLKWCFEASLWCKGLSSSRRSSKRKTFVQHLYNVGPTSSTLVQHCINVIQMFCVCWGMLTAIHTVRLHHTVICFLNNNKYDWAVTVTGVSFCTSSAAVAMFFSWTSFLVNFYVHIIIMTPESWP